MLWTLISILLLVIFIVMFPRWIKELKQVKKDTLLFHKNLKYESREIFEDVIVDGYNCRIYREKESTLKSKIKGYMISTKSNESYLHIDFNEPLKNDEILQVRVYDRLEKYLTTMFVKLNDQSEPSPMILLTKDAIKVNIKVIKETNKFKDFYVVDEDNYNTYHNVLIKMSSSLILFYISFAYLILYIKAGDKLDLYMNYQTLLLGAALISVFALLNYGFIRIHMLFMKKRGAN